MYFNGTPLPGLLISGQDTYLTWEMIPTKRLHVNPPEPKTTYVDLPGANGGLDYTQLLTGLPTYGYRKGSWEFLLIPGDSWVTVYESLCETLNGKHHEIILQDDPNYYYTGRLKVSEWQSNAYNSLITIDYVLDPDKKSVSGDPVDHDEEDLAHAARILRKTENAGKVITLNNDRNAVLVSESSISPPVLSSLSVSANGSYTPGTGVDGFDSVIVSVPSATMSSLSISLNGTYSASSYGVDGFNVITINVATGEDGNSIYYPGSYPYDPALVDGDNIAY